VQPRIVRSKAELLAVLRARKEDLDISHETVDGLVGWADRLSTKVLAPMPRKGMSGDMLQAVLDALALGICQITIAEDAEQASRIRHRWDKRKPFGPRPRKALQCVVAQDGPVQSEINFGDESHEAHKTMSTENFTVRVDPEFKRTIAQAAKKDRRTPSDFARLAIEDAIKAKETKTGEAA